MNHVMHSASTARAGLAATTPSAGTATASAAEQSRASVLIPAFERGAAAERANPVFLESVALYRAGQWNRAFDALVRLADAGHVPAAHLALMMLRHGRMLYGIRFCAQAIQVARWAGCVLGCPTRRPARRSGAA